MIGTNWIERTFEREEEFGIFFGGWLPREDRGYCCRVCLVGALHLSKQSPSKVVKEKKSLGKLGLAIGKPFVFAFISSPSHCCIADRLPRSDHCLL